MPQIPLSRPPHLLAGIAMLLGLASCATTDLAMIAPQPTSGPPELVRGREIYVGNCTKCHTAEPVGKYSRAEWEKIMPEMIDETNLKPADAAAVRAYVFALAR